MPGALVSVVYASQPDAKFDLEYCQYKSSPVMVSRLLCFGALQNARP